MAKTTNIGNKDLYLLLGVDETANEKEIVKGYRKKALGCHPDKNPDNPKAAEEFHELSLALKVLTDVAARAAYDRSRKAKKEVEARNKVLDGRRKKFKEDLEARERAAEKNHHVSKVDADKELQLEIDRLRKECSRILEDQQNYLRELMKMKASETEKEKKGDENKDIPRIKLKWRSAKGDPANGGYNETILSDIFSCYGRVSTLLVSSKRNGSAILEFEPSGVSSDVLDENGLADNPLNIVWLSGKPTVNSNSDSINSTYIPQYSSSIPNSSKSSVNFASPTESGNNSDYNSGSRVNFPCGDYTSGSQSQSSDFESLVLRKMRQAEERKRLIEQMAKEDEDNG